MDSINPQPPSTTLQHIDFDFRKAKPKSEEDEMVINEKDGRQFVKFIRPSILNPYLPKSPRYATEQDAIGILKQYEQKSLEILKQLKSEKNLEKAKEKFETIRRIAARIFIYSGCEVKNQEFTKETQDVINDIATKRLAKLKKPKDFIEFLSKKFNFYSYDKIREFGINLKNGGIDHKVLTKKLASNFLKQIFEEYSDEIKKEFNLNVTTMEKIIDDKFRQFKHDILMQGAHKLDYNFFECLFFPETYMNVIYEEIRKTGKKEDIMRIDIDNISDEVRISVKQIRLLLEVIRLSNSHSKSFRYSIELLLNRESKLREKLFSFNKLFSLNKDDDFSFLEVYGKYARGNKKFNEISQKKLDRISQSISRISTWSVPYDNFVSKITQAIKEEDLQKLELVMKESGDHCLNNLGERIAQVPY